MRSVGAERCHESRVAAIFRDTPSPLLLEKCKTWTASGLNAVISQRGPDQERRTLPAHEPDVRVVAVKSCDVLSDKRGYEFNQC